MAAAGLGEVEEFPFLEPPDRRSVSDGKALLEELGAFERRAGGVRLTPIGRRLARLPLDPRLARMVVESDSRGCLREVTVIAAAMSIQDPREHPRDEAPAADEMHRRFADRDSDFTSLVKLWDHLAELRGGLSGNQFRKRCRAEYLNPLRVREWQDVAGQIRQVLRSEGVHANRDPAGAEQIHLSLLAGLLSHIGMHDRSRGDYLGARNSRWQISRESGLGRHRPAWAVAGTLVETERTWARTVARIDPAWVEVVGSHLAIRSHSEPWWDPGRSEAMTEERVTVYGLPVVTGRRVLLSRVDPEQARWMFIDKGLVEGDRSAGVPPLERTRELVAQIEELGRRARRGDLLAGDETLAAFYDARIPPEITGGRRFDRWWNRAKRTRPDLLDVPASVLLNPAAGSIEVSAYPDRWALEGLELPLRYVYEPGAPDDGVTTEIPLAALNRADPADFEWQVPGLRAELIATLVRALPKSLRRNLPPAPEAARLVLEDSRPEDGPFLNTVADRLTRISGEEIEPGLWDGARIPDHLVMSFDVVGEGGAVIGRGKNLRALKALLAGELRDALARLAPGIERSGEIAWCFGDLPSRIEDGLVRGYPALVDEGETVGVTLFEDPTARAQNMWQGTRRLLLLSTPLPVAHIERRLTQDTRFALARSGTPLAGLLEDCAAAVVDQILVARGGPAFDQAGFEAIADAVRARLVDRVTSLAIISGGVIAAAERVLDKADRLQARTNSGGCGPAIEDVRRQVRRLVQPGFVKLYRPRASPGPSAVHGGCRAQAGPSPGRPPAGPDPPSGHRSGPVPLRLGSRGPSVRRSRIGLRRGSGRHPLDDRGAAGVALGPGAGHERHGEREANREIARRGGRLTGRHRTRRLPG